MLHGAALFRRVAGRWVVAAPQQPSSADIALARKADGRAAGPLAGIINSRSVKTMESGRPRGFDPGKGIGGRKRHILTDASVLLVAAQVHAANNRDREMALPRCSRPFAMLFHGCVMPSPTAPVPVPSSRRSSSERSMDHRGRQAPGRPARVRRVAAPLGGARNSVTPNVYNYLGNIHLRHPSDSPVNFLWFQVSNTDNICSLSWSRRDGNATTPVSDGPFRSISRGSLDFVDLL